MKNLITIIIPTCNRPLELARLIPFLHAFGHQIPIFVLDGGDEKSGDQNRKMCEHFSNVEYLKFDRTLHLGLRIAEGLRAVKTPCVVICPDDDFVFPESIIECANFLQDHPDYSAATGRVWTMRYYPDKAFFKHGVALGNELNYGDSINYNQFIQRALFYFAYTAIGAFPLTYAVQRTESALGAYELVSDQIRYTSIELLTNSSFLINGKIAKLPIEFGIRDYSSITIRDAIREGDNAYIPLEDIRYMKPLLIEALLKVEKTPPQIAEYAIESLLSLWVDTREDLGVTSNTKFLSRMRLVLSLSQCLISSIAPSVVAESIGLPEEIYKQLLKTQRKFIASRKNSTNHY